MFGVRWVHIFEEDTAGGEVYRDATGTVPLSRRPREAFELHDNGSAELYSGGPDDRSTARPASWTRTRDGLLVTSADGRTRFDVTADGPSRLVVRKA